MKWQMWSRFKDLNGNQLNVADEYPLGHQQLEKYIFDAAKLKGYDADRVRIESFTDQWFAWTIDRSGHKRKFLSLTP